MNINMRKTQSGFTLIELVIVIVILGILAAIAVPRYIDLTSDAQDATCAGIKGALLSNASILLADANSGSPAGTGNAANLADIHGDMAKDGWTAAEDTTACTITATLTSNNHVCAAVTIPDSLAADC